MNIKQPCVDGTARLLKFDPALPGNPDHFHQVEAHLSLQSFDCAVGFFIIEVTGLFGDMARAALSPARCQQARRLSCLAQQYKTCEAETAGIMVETTAGMLVVLPATFEAAKDSRRRIML
jgi:hypothetical protein